MPQTITNIPRCFPQILTLPKFWYHLAHSFSRKNGPFGFGRAPSDSQKVLSKSKGPFLCENEFAKWYQNFGAVKIFGRQRGIFVIVCGICYGVDKMQFSKWHNWPKKPRKCCTKKACFSITQGWNLLQRRKLLAQMRRRRLKTALLHPTAAKMMWRRGAKEREEKTLRNLILAKYAEMTEDSFKCWG